MILKNQANQPHKLLPEAYIANYSLSQGAWTGTHEHSSPLLNHRAVEKEWNQG